MAMVPVCTSEVRKSKGEVLEGSCRVPGRHLLQNLSRNTQQNAEVRTDGRYAGPCRTFEGAARKGHIHMAGTPRYLQKRDRGSDSLETTVE